MLISVGSKIEGSQDLIPLLPQTGLREKVLSSDLLVQDAPSGCLGQQPAPCEFMMACIG